MVSCNLLTVAGGDRGHGVVFKAWIRRLWWNEGALSWLNDKKSAPGLHKDLACSPWSLTDNISDARHDFCIIWKFNTCNWELLFFSGTANTAKLQAWCHWWVTVGWLDLYSNGHTQREPWHPSLPSLSASFSVVSTAEQLRQSLGQVAGGGGVELVAFKGDELGMISAIYITQLFAWQLQGKAL